VKKVREMRICYRFFLEFYFFCYLKGNIFEIGEFLKKNSINTQETPIGFVDSYRARNDYRLIVLEN